MPAWVWRAYDLRTGALLSDVDVESWSHEDRLNDSGSWSARLLPPSGRNGAVLAAATLAATREGQTIVAFRDGVPMFTGVIPPHGRTIGDTVDLAGGGLLKALDLQVIEQDPSYVVAGLDQHYLARDLVALAQVQAGPIIDTSQVTTSGQLRDQTWFRWEAKNIGEALRQKSALIGGFDFDLRTEFDGGIVRRLRCWTPRRGRVYVEGESPAYVVGGNALSVPSVSGSAGSCTHVVAQGIELDPTTRARAVRTATSPLEALGVSRVTFVLDLSDVGTLADPYTSLQQHADGFLALHGWDFDDPDELVVEIDPRDVTELGDDCRVKVPAGLETWFPTGFDAVRRTVAHKWTADVNGTERLELVTVRPL